MKPGVVFLGKKPETKAKNKIGKLLARYTKKKKRKKEIGSKTDTQN